MKYEIHITDFGLVGGQHFYGTVKSDDWKVRHELTRPDPSPVPDWYDDDERAHAAELWTTIRFLTEWDVVVAAKKWFDSAPEVQPGDKLVVWKGHLGPADFEQIRKWRAERAS